MKDLKISFVDCFGNKKNNASTSKGSNWLNNIAVSVKGCEGVAKFSATNIKKADFELESSSLPKSTTKAAVEFIKGRKTANFLHRKVSAVKGSINVK